MSKPNRNPLKQIFYTFPQSGNVSQGDFLEVILSMTQVDYYKIATETHEDGNPHFHAYVKYSRGITKAKILKSLKNKYPNDYKRIDVQACKSPQDAVNYLDKECPTQTIQQSHPDYETFLALDSKSKLQKRKDADKAPCADHNCQNCKYLLKQYSQVYGQTFYSKQEFAEFLNNHSKHELLEKIKKTF